MSKNSLPACWPVAELLSSYGGLPELHHHRLSIVATTSVFPIFPTFLNDFAGM
jgi:hypothetical protein